LKKLEILLASISCAVLTSCATVTPDKIQDNVASYDNSTPSQYNKHNSGVIGLLDDGIIITKSSRDKYNNLIEMYRIKLKKDKAVDLQKDSGIRTYKDKFNNELYILDNEYAVYYSLMNSWLREKVPQDSIIDKAVDKISN
jgi:hypothetical protein